MVFSGMERPQTKRHTCVKKAHNDGILVVIDEKLQCTLDVAGTL